MATDPYRYFRLEARELLDQFSSGLLELEKGEGGAALVQRLLRYAHTLKGAARVVKQQEIAENAHAIEDALSPYRDSADAIPADRLQIVLKILSDVGDRMRLLQIPTERTAGSLQTTQAAETPRTVRVDIAELDALLDGVSEIHALLNGLRTASRTLEPARRLADMVLAQLAPRGMPDRGMLDKGGFGGVSDISRQLFAGLTVSTPDRAHSMSEELWKVLGGFERSLGTAIDQMDRELYQLRDAAEQLRLVSVESLLSSLERTARDAAQTLGKSVTFSGSGGDMRLDAHVLGTVQGALVQIIRNALAHGIESESERRVSGKPNAGAVAVDIFRRGRRIVFKCSDDGCGVDIDAVRRIALQRGLVAADAAPSSGEDLIKILLQGGISTSDAVTEVSGRGIGLDVVRSAIEQLGGSVSVSTAQGQGTTFQLIVPSALAAVEALMIEAAGTIVGIPLAAVRNTLRLTDEEISRASAGSTVLYESVAIPFMPMQRLLDGTAPSIRSHWTAIVVAGATGLAAFGVDGLLGTARIVMRPLPASMPASAVVSGACLDAEGNPQLVLDPDGLVGDAQNGETLGPEAAAKDDPILVIDDSLTTRMLEQSILESAGYDVDVAVSAEDGLERARRKRYALFLVDVEMPGMDGFTFIERVRSDPALHEIPAILVTSRASPDDRRRGSDVGAQGYVVKSEFDQASLLKMIKPLIG